MEALAGHPRRPNIAPCTQESARAPEGKRTGLLTYTGTNADMLDYVSVMLLDGARVEVTDGNLIATGPAWIWQWGHQFAENHEQARVTALVPEARPFTWIVD